MGAAAVERLVHLEAVSLGNKRVAIPVHQAGRRELGRGVVDRRERQQVPGRVAGREDVVVHELRKPLRDGVLAAVRRDDRRRVDRPAGLHGGRDAARAALALELGVQVTVDPCHHQREVASRAVAHDG